MEKTKRINIITSEIALKEDEYEILEQERTSQIEEVEFLFSEMQEEGLLTKRSKKFFEFLYLYYPNKLEKLFIIYAKYRMNKIPKSELCDIANEFLAQFDKYLKISFESIDALIEINRLRFEKERLVRKRKK